MDGFNGVATKYLANYMSWFKWIELFKTDKDQMCIRDRYYLYLKVN